jgi:glucokinase
VDIGGTKIAVGVVDNTGCVHTRAECPTMPERGFADGLGRITNMIQELEQQSGSSVHGIGIGCTGPVYPKTGVIGNVDFLPGWENAPIVAELERRFDIPVAMENDADAAALGEWMWGTGRGCQNFLFVTISTGIGSGWIVDGQLYRGVNGSHPEIGHHIIDPSGPACACGAHGCWESLASGSALALWYKENAPSELAAQNLDAREICTRNDSYSQLAIARVGRYLGLGLANLITLFLPDIIALGGGLMQSYELFWPTIQKTIQTSSGYVPKEKVRIIQATLGKNVGIIGAACSWLSHFQK